MTVQLTLFMLFICEFFALAHHGSLAVRRRAAARHEHLEPITTSQLDLARLQAICAAVVVSGVALRLLLGRPIDSSLFFLGWGLFTMSFAAGVYWRYPAAAPVAITMPDWTVGYPGARATRYFLAVLSSVAAPVLFAALIFGQNPA
ncbi:MAG: hypothetical protein Q7V14_01610 [Coriobacteriia bacterium]|nr:hypothetical protein [Coriobacteriia bacterium]